MNTERSSRHQIAEKFAELIIENGLTSIHGGEVSLRKGKRSYYHTSFSRPMYLDGSVDVYSEKFVRISWSTSYRPLDSYASVVLDAETAMKFIKLAFIDLNFTEAKELLK